MFKIIGQGMFSVTVTAYHRTLTTFFDYYFESLIKLLVARI